MPRLSKNWDEAYPTLNKAIDRLDSDELRLNTLETKTGYQRQLVGGISANTQKPNLIYASPALVSGTPTFRTLVAADLSAATSAGWTYSSANKRWELFDSTITSWLQAVQPGWKIDSNFGTATFDATSVFAIGNHSYIYTANIVPVTQVGGSLRLTTSAVANNFAYFNSGGYVGAVGASVFPVDSTNIMAFWFVIDPVQSDANTQQRVGFQSIVTEPPTNGIYLERLGTDANWFLVTRAGGVQTRNTTGIAHAAGKVGFIVVKNGTTDVTVYQAGNNTPLATNNTNIVANGTNLAAFIQCKTLAATVKSIDTYLFCATGKSVLTGY